MINDQKLQASVERFALTWSNDFSFVIQTPKRKWALTAASLNQYEAWYQARTGATMAPPA